MNAGTAFSRKTESVLNRVNPSAVHVEKNVNGTRQNSQLSKHQLGGYFANMDRAAYLLLMIWNQTAQAKDLQEFKHHLIIDVIVPLEWFNEVHYINKPKFRTAVNALIDIALTHITKAKRLTKIKQSEMTGISQTTYRTKWEPRLIELETYLHQLLNQAGQQVHRNI
ncbi:hypothetical protein J3998_12100 [Thiomicrorhabdus sp. 6S2-11]|uniref:Uncharacterized protein n=1 Tax=Thiomicrorhabdus marina TaxID=2818442 RepID=A0ABS3Q7I1_9GAMM|nr:hypothetical protein [Thiomicrorhabdus marina]MBO1928316.1 hypothetical protein [Thiomicrorhabdus marina]